MAFKLKVLDTADSVFLSIDSATMKRKQTSLTTFLAEKVLQGMAIFVY